MLSVARGLEEGRFDGIVARGLSRAWGTLAARRLARPLAIAEGVNVVAVGGATLGGSGKTPLAIACAEALAQEGARVAFVGHAYGARPVRAEVVSTGTPLEAVGDEALVAARALEPHDVPVIVGPSRRLAIALASRHADWLVLDGVLQTTPVPAALSLLAVDAAEPWGRARAVPPRGDLRAPVEALLAVADRVVPVGQHSLEAPVVSGGARTTNTLLSWDALRSLRLGLACALARPDRVLRYLAHRGITPVALVRARDHHAISGLALRAASARVDLWVATAKCAHHVSDGGIPLATLEYDVVCGPPLLEWLRAARLDPRRGRQ
jgi:tetraacyldisaccharide 4'-kinase